MEPSQTKPSAKLRALLILGALVLLALWGWALVPLFERWGDPRADGFHLIPTFWATITALPLGVIALVGGVSGTEKGRAPRAHQPDDRRWPCGRGGRARDRAPACGTLQVAPPQLFRPPSA